MGLLSTKTAFAMIEISEIIVSVFESSTFLGFVFRMLLLISNTYDNIITGKYHWNISFKKKLTQALNKFYIFQNKKRRI